MLVKLILIALLLFIVFNLFRALWLMLKNDPDAVSMSKYLGRRVLFSAIVMALLILALAMGWISPHQRPY
jgi:cytochrome bd-type quinol oxidase subunit 2